MWQKPKTNWTANDYYNAGDLNRLESNIAEISGVIALYDTPPTLAPAVTDRDMAHIEFADSLTRIENNLEILKNALYTPVGWRGTKAWIAGMPFDWQDASRLETNVLLLYQTAVNIYGYLQYCGAFTCGNDNSYL